VHSLQSGTLGSVSSVAAYDHQGVCVSCLVGSIANGHRTCFFSQSQHYLSLGDLGRGRKRKKTQAVKATPHIN
jgi:hypothetical protein